MNHILSGCRIALCQVRYRWRHDQVLRQIAMFVDEKRKKRNSQIRREEKKIKFVRAGEKRDPTQNSSSDSYIDGANDWKLVVDLDGNLKFPKKVAETNQRPDMILLSESTKRMGLIELTVPSEDRVEDSGELKKVRTRKC